MRLLPISDKGVTLPEIILVMIIFGIMATIAVPKFLSLKEHTERGRCAANRAAINSALVSTYGVLNSRDPQQYRNWLNTITFDAVDDSMFNSGHIPLCPGGGAYTIQNGEVNCSIHGK